MNTLLWKVQHFEDLYYTSGSRKAAEVKGGPVMRDEIDKIFHLNETRDGHGTTITLGAPVETSIGTSLGLNQQVGSRFRPSTRHG